MTGLMDTHFHTQAMARKGVDVEKLLQDLFSAGFAGGIDVGTECDDLPLRADRLAPYPRIKLSAGIGPWGIDDGREPIDAQIGTMVAAIERYTTDCIGEIGLDAYWKYGTPALQEELFIRQIELADTLDLPIIIHNRDADERTGEILKAHPPKRGGILHCFSATMDLAEIALERGFYISFAGTITYKKNGYLRDILRDLPLERVLLETDSPYLSPEPLRGTVNTPLRMPFIYDVAATVRQMPVSELAQAIRTNFATLFSADRTF